MSLPDILFAPFHLPVYLERTTGCAKPKMRCALLTWRAPGGDVPDHLVLRRDLRPRHSAGTSQPKPRCARCAMSRPETDLAWGARTYGTRCWPSRSSVWIYSRCP
eukprot:648341-Rhodomonas_salina.1